MSENKDNGTTQAEATPRETVAPEHQAEPTAPAPAPTPAAPLVKPPPILCLGAARTGTASLGAALNILGVKRVHHGLETYTEEYNWQYKILDRAADASFPVLPTYTGKPFTRAQWDELFGEYDAVTDIASFYAMSLIKAYPDAKVILVERDIDRWCKSFEQVWEPWTHKSMRMAVRGASKLSGSDSGPVSYKFLMGWTQSKSHKELEKNSRAAYIRHYKEIREAVPPEQLLNFKLGDGWGPLAKFLGKEEPDVAFPHVNDSVAYQAHIEKTKKDVFMRIRKRLVPFAK